MKTNKITSPKVKKGEIYWFDPLKETKVGVSPLAFILSGKVHNENSSLVIFNLAGTEDVEEVREFFEVACEAGGKKIKIMVSAVHSFNKEVFLREAKYLGKANESTLKLINEKVKLLLELDN